MSLTVWSSIFLFLYVAVMLGIGILATRRLKGADDFATARRCYGPFFLALAFSATTASGATFLGFPGMAYQAGLSASWGLLYPVGVYIGVLISMRMVSAAGHRWQIRSMPEFIGRRYQSDGMRILVALASLLLFFYLAGQLLSGLVMFEVMLGLPAVPSLIITVVIMLGYVSMGGAHADILTDGVQGLVMLLIAATVVGMFAFGSGLDGGFSEFLIKLEQLDPNLTKTFNSENQQFRSWWSALALVVACIPMGCLPHIGNKLWALNDDRQRLKFVLLSATFAFTLATLGLGGISARAVLGDTLLGPDGNPNQALPLLFIQQFPTWLAAFIGVGILAAVMSTADGLVVSSAQLFANDLYRQTFVPRYRQQLDEAEIDRRVLSLSRWATAGIMVICASIALACMDKNINLLIWAGNGGIMSAFSGPVILGCLWKRVTRAGAYAGLVIGLISFLVLHTSVIQPVWFEGTVFFTVAQWLDAESPNPMSCAAIGECLSVAGTWLVSLFTQPLTTDHIEALFPDTHAVRD